MTMKVNQCTQFLKMQGECLDMLTQLIEFDKEQAEKTGVKAENSFALKAFVDTQRKALNMAETLLEKHKENLLEIERKAEAEAKKKIEEENAKKKAGQKKQAVKKDLKKAKADENSLFADFGETEDEAVELEQFANDDESDCQDDYGFEEDMGED